LLKYTKNFKVFALILLTSALLLVAINPNIPSVKATTQDSVYVYTSLGGTVSANGTSLTGGNIYNYDNGSAVNFTATAGTGFQFLDWIYVSTSGGATSTANPFVYTVSVASYSIQAMFIPTSSAVTLPTPTPTVNEFSSATAIIIVAILVTSAFGTHTHTKKAKK